MNHCVFLSNKIISVQDKIIVSQARHCHVKTIIPRLKNKTKSKKENRMQRQN